jgi:pseudouridine-5'-phosphate glycosidase
MWNGLCIMVVDRTLSPFLDVAPRIAAALAAGGPVVALETTIVTHGMPYPQNVETALEVEAMVRAGGAEPATIAILDGRIRVGLEPDDVRALAHLTNVRKVSRADLPFALATKAAGATTVAATMICAALAGIHVFATGGIGGVHRGAESTFDISADLEELAQSPVAVICAGAKALLDIPKTLEVLETRGVPVICYQTDEFPAFWSRQSGLPAPLRLDTPADIAHAIRVQRELG